MQHLGEVTFLNEGVLPPLMDQLKYTPKRGDHSQMVVLVGRNVPDLRAAIQAAGESRLLKGKQVALVMYGDSIGHNCDSA